MATHQIMLLAIVAGMTISSLVAEEPPAPTELSPTALQTEIRRLIKDLGDDDFRVREAAMNRLIEIGKDARPAVITGRRSADLEVATRCRRIDAMIEEQLRADVVVHVVGLYESKGRPVVVEVDQPGKPVVLVLSAYESVKWQVRATKETTILSVIASGYHRQEVTGVIAPVSLLSYDQRSPNFFYAYKESGRDYQKLEAIVFEMVNQYPTTFQGRYSAGNEPFFVPSQK